MEDQLITGYDIELSEAPCAPGSGKYSVKVVPREDISAVLPYINAVMQDTVYDKETGTLIGREGKRQYAFRPKEILVAGVGEAYQAPEVARQAVEMLNRVWHTRVNIKPSFVERKLPTVIDIYKNLPKTNCRLCGHPTCLVFAAELRAGNCTLAQCTPLSKPEYVGKKEAIRKLFEEG